MLAPPVLLIHGFASSFDHGWRAHGWVDLLEEMGREVVGVDLLGHGAAPKPHDPAEYAEVERRVASAIAATEQVDVVGFSAGAMIALRLMADDPARFRKGVVMGIGDEVLEPHLSTPAIDLEASPNPQDGRSVVFQRLADRPGNDRAALVAFLGRKTQPVTRAELARITCPMLVVIGDRDFNYPADRLGAALNGAQLVVLRGVDHFATPADVRGIEAVLSFLEA